MPVVKHTVSIPATEDNKPNPSGTLQFPDQPGPSPDNMLECSYPCIVEGHNSHVIHLLFCADQGISLGDNDPAVFGPDDTLNYDPPFS